MLLQSVVSLAAWFHDIEVADQDVVLGVLLGAFGEEPGDPVDLLYPPFILDAGR